MMNKIWEYEDFLRTPVSPPVWSLQIITLKLAANFEDNYNKIYLQGLIGSDILQFIRELRVINYMNGPAYQLASSLVPFGNIDQFLYPHQISKYARKAIHNYKTIIL